MKKPRVWVGEYDCLIYESREDAEKADKEVEDEKDTPIVLTKHGRTPDQVDEFYKLSRMILRKKYALMDWPDKTYWPLLKCDRCHKDTLHRELESKVYSLAWECEGKAMKSTKMMQNWGCQECGQERAWGRA